MNINAINGFNFTGRQVKKEAVVKATTKLDDYVTEFLKENSEVISRRVKFYGRDLKIAQREKVLYANSGNITTRLDMKKLYDPTHNQDINPRRFFLDFFTNNIIANSIANEKGLKKGFESLCKKS